MTNKGSLLQEEDNNKTEIIKMNEKKTPQPKRPQQQPKRQQQQQQPKRQQQQQPKRPQQQ
jgi:hypothetical protein